MLVKNLFRHWTYQVFSPGTVLREKYESFKTLLAHDKAAHEHLAALEKIYYEKKPCDFNTVVSIYEDFSQSVSGMVDELLRMCPSSYWTLKDYFKKFDFYIRFMLAPPQIHFSPPFALPLDGRDPPDAPAVGNKAVRLSQICTDLHLPVPDGFAITTSAFHYFMESNNLRGPINKILSRCDISDYTTIESAAGRIGQMISDAKIPAKIASEVTAAVDALIKRHGKKLCFAVRSSAVKEDGSVSFAGQYRTLLDVKPSAVLNSYKDVISGKYTAHAIFYRISHGLLDDETPMAALVLDMIDPTAAGVMYTRTPVAAEQHRKNDFLSIHSVRGQGDSLVSGNAAADEIIVSKSDVRQIDIKAAPGRGKVSLGELSVAKLARWGVRLEKFFGSPQDIEWCQGKDKSLYILQSRPLGIAAAADRTPGHDRRPGIKKTLVSGGDPICSGIGCGRVFHLKDLSMMGDVPKGAVLMVRSAPPQLVAVVKHINAVVIEKGSFASHFASIAREFKVPALVNVNRCFERIPHGQFVMVDGAAAAVSVIDESSCPVGRKEDKGVFDKSPFMKKLGYVISFSAELKLTDPSSDSFSPEGCRSLHDIIRFAHETAVREMFFLGGRKGSRKKGAKKLVSTIPMLFYVLDVGRGTTAEHDEKTIRREEIASVPFQSVLDGLMDPGICWSETTHFDWAEYDRIVMAGGIISADDAQFGSYAVISDDYMNVNFRFGYHFVIIDAICTPQAAGNHILFRFSGGGGDIEGRNLRADFIREILKRLGFWVRVTSDLIDAELKPVSMNRAQEILVHIGRLLGATKLMDMYLKDSMRISALVDDFMSGRYDFRNITENLKND